MRNLIKKLFYRSPPLRFVGINVCGRIIDFRGWIGIAEQVYFKVASSRMINKLLWNLGFGLYKYGRVGGAGKELPAQDIISSDVTAEVTRV